MDELMDYIERELKKQRIEFYPAFEDEKLLYPSFRFKGKLGGFRLNFDIIWPDLDIVYSYGGAELKIFKNVYMVGISMTQYRELSKKTTDDNKYFGPSEVGAIRNTNFILAAPREEYSIGGEEALELAECIYKITLMRCNELEPYQIKKNYEKIIPHILRAYDNAKDFTRDIIERNNAEWLSDVIKHIDSKCEFRKEMMLH